MASFIRDSGRLTHTNKISYISRTVWHIDTKPSTTSWPSEWAFWWNLNEAKRFRSRRVVFVYHFMEICKIRKSSVTWVLQLFDSKPPPQNRLCWKLSAMLKTISWYSNNVYWRNGCAAVLCQSLGCPESLPSLRLWGCTIDRISNGQSDVRQKLVDLHTTKWSGFMCKPWWYAKGASS